MCRGLGTRSRLAVALVIAALGAGSLFAGAALGGTWYQQYFANSYLNGSGAAQSASNYGVDFNDTSWATSGSNGTAHAYLSLCNTNNNCYSAATESGGYGYDSRSISYGHAICFPQVPVYYYVWFNYCDADNF
jgi:hypothetical protein